MITISTEVVFHNCAMPGWYREELLSEDWAALRGCSLMYLHHLLEGLERRLIELIGAGNWEEYDNDPASIVDLAQEAGFYWTARNYYKLYSLVAKRDAREIAKLTGRAA